MRETSARYLKASEPDPSQVPHCKPKIVDEFLSIAEQVDAGDLRGGRQENLHLTVLGTSALPPATPLDISQLARYHGHWVQITGRVSWQAVMRAPSTPQPQV